MSSKVKVVDNNQLERMHTGSLLKRLNDLHRCEESFKDSDRYGYEEEPVPSETGYIEFKNTKEWKDAYEAVKKVLARREHRPRGNERLQNGRGKI